VGFASGRDADINQPQEKSVATAVETGPQHSTSLLETLSDGVDSSQKASSQRFDSLSSRKLGSTTQRQIISTSFWPSSNFHGHHVYIFVNIIHQISSTRSRYNSPLLSVSKGMK
jgi:hypothetical protein